MNIAKRTARKRLHFNLTGDTKVSSKTADNRTTVDHVMVKDVKVPVNMKIGNRRPSIGFLKFLAGS